MLWTYLFNAAVAAALGAGTNELAIIAILRHILPRKKDEFAVRIRNIIATDLLSPAKMRDKLDDPRVSDLLRRNIGDALDAFLQRDLPAPALLFADQSDELDVAAAQMRDSLSTHILARCNTDAFENEVLRPFLVERWDALKNRSPRSFLSNENTALSAHVQAAVRSLFESKALRRGFRRALDTWLAEKLTRTDSLADLLSPGMLAAAKDFIAAQWPLITERLTGILREPSVRDEIAGSIMSAITEQLRSQGVLGSIKGAVVSAMRVERDVRGVCDRLPDTLQERFANPEIRDRLADALRNAAESAMRARLEPAARSPATRDAFTATVVDGVWQKDTFNELGRKAGDAVEEAMSRPLRETAEWLGIDASRQAVLDEAANRYRRILASSATRELLEGQFDELYAAWKARPLGKLRRFVNDEMWDRLAAAAAVEARAMLRARLGDFAEEAGVWDVVVDSVKGYSDKEIADLVLTLARTELRWVTILGGVIGAVVGITQTFVQSLAAS